MSYSLPLATTADLYTPAATLTCPNARVVQVTISNAAVYLQSGRGIGGVLWDEPASFRVPGVWTIPGPIDAIRMRSAAVGKPAEVSADAW